MQHATHHRLRYAFRIAMFSTIFLLFDHYNFGILHSLFLCYMVSIQHRFFIFLSRLPLAVHALSLASLNSQQDFRRNIKNIVFSFTIFIELQFSWGFEAWSKSKAKSIVICAHFVYTFVVEDHVGHQIEFMILHCVRVDDKCQSCFNSRLY